MNTFITLNNINLITTVNTILFQNGQEKIFKLIYYKFINIIKKKKSF